MSLVASASSVQQNRGGRDRKVERVVEESSRRQQVLADKGNHVLSCHASGHVVFQQHCNLAVSSSLPNITCQAREADLQQKKQHAHQLGMARQNALTASPDMHRLRSFRLVRLDSAATRARGSPPAAAATVTSRLMLVRALQLAARCTSANGVITRPEVNINDVQQQQEQQQQQKLCA
jgi:hypothetical protein